jgi:hypothetical protein
MSIKFFQPINSGEVSQYVLYASQNGAALNSNISTGGGTDDTAALQALLDQATTLGGLHLIIETPALISSPLRLHSNTWLEFLLGGGLYMANGSNCDALTMALSGATQSTSNVRVTGYGAVINMNRANNTLGHTDPSKTQGDPYCWGARPVWFGSCTNVWISGLTVWNASEFNFAFSNAYHVRGRDCQVAYPDGAPVPQGTDGVHVYGPCDDVDFEITYAGGDDAYAEVPVEVTVAAGDAGASYGSGYTGATFVCGVSGGGGSGFTGTATVSAGGVVSVAVLTPGSGYSVAVNASLNLTGGAGSGAQGRPYIVNGQILGFYIGSPRRGPVGGPITNGRADVTCVNSGGCIRKGGFSNASGSTSTGWRVAARGTATVGWNQSGIVVSDGIIEEFRVYPASGYPPGATSIYMPANTVSGRISVNEVGMGVGVHLNSGVYGPDVVSPGGEYFDALARLRFGCLAAYNFDSTSALLVDSTGNGNTLTNHGTVTSVSGLLGNAANFVAGSSQYLSLSGGSTPNLAALAEWTVCGWFNYTTTNLGLVPLFVFSDGTTRSVGLYMGDGTHGSTAGTLIIAPSSGGNSTFGPSGQYPIADWVLWACRVRPSDGAVDVVLSTQNGLQHMGFQSKGFGTVSTPTFTFGGDPLTGNTFYSTSQQDSVLIFNSCLDEYELNLLYNPLVNPHYVPGQSGQSDNLNAGCGRQFSFRV